VDASMATVPEVAAETVDVAGTPVAVRRRGTGEPLLFLHGAGFTGKWLRFHHALAAGADVIAPEHVGYGGTPMQDWLEDIGDLVLHYDDLRATLGLDRFHLVGYSLGGWIAAAYATLFPDRLASLTLITPAGMQVPGKAPFVDMFTMEPAQLFSTLFNDPSNVGEVMEDITDPDVAVRLYEEQSTVARLVWNPRYDRKMPRRLRRVSCPALVLGAEDDRLVPNEACDRYAEFLPDARLQRIPGTGHALIIEQPEQTAKAVLEFSGSAR
jgi:pimeloyl-ACP methyl ester carboxylesterase